MAERQRDSSSMGVQHLHSSSGPRQSNAPPGGSIVNIVKKVRGLRRTTTCQRKRSKQEIVKELGHTSVSIPVAVSCAILFKSSSRERRRAPILERERVFQRKSDCSLFGCTTA